MDICLPVLSAAENRCIHLMGALRDRLIGPKSGIAGAFLFFQQNHLSRVYSGSRVCRTLWTEDGC